MNVAKPHDRWAAGEHYEPYVGRWSRLVAREFVNWLQVRSRKEWLDVGCGTGALTRTILDLADPKHVHGVDPSPGFIDYATSRIIDGHASFAVGHAEMLPETDGSFDIAVSGLVLNFVPKPERGISEMVRAIRPGGIVASYVWDYAGRMELMRYFWDAAVALNPAAVELDEGRRFPICNPDQLHAAFLHAGLLHVETRPIEVPTLFRDFADYWTPFLGGQGPAPSYAMSLEPRARDALRDRLHSKLPIAADGSIPLVARAWAVRGTKP